MTDTVTFDSRPSPEPDHVSQPFFDSMAQGVLSVQQCGQCGSSQLGELICKECFSSRLEWVPASGRGTIHSYAVVHLPYHPAFAVPYAVVSVELDEGPRLLANLEECGPKDVKIGMAVVMRPSRLDSGVTVPLFRPA